MPSQIRTRILATPKSVATAAAELVTEALELALDAQGTAVLALSGGSTPKQTYQLLAKEALDWGRIHVVQTDERITNDATSTSASVIEANLITPAAIPESHWHPMPTSATNLVEASLEYAALLASLNDDAIPNAAVLGMGEDGHTASLFAGDPSASADEPVAITHAYQGTVRLTLGHRVLAAIPTRVVLACGSSKAPAVSRLLNAEVPATDPTANVLGTTGWLFLDDAAAGNEALRK